MATPTHSRRDAERNHEAIVTAAIAVLADAPDATMAEIATASGNRAVDALPPLPGPCRALVQAISVRIRSEARTLVEQQLQPATVDDAVEVLVTLADALAGLGDRYRFLLNQDEHRLGRGERRPDDLVGGFLSRAHAAGTVRTDLDPDWLQQAYIYVMIAAVKTQFADPETQRDADREDRAQPSLAAGRVARGLGPRGKTLTGHWGRGPGCARGRRRAVTTVGGSPRPPQVREKQGWGPGSEGCLGRCRRP